MKTFIFLAMLFFSFLRANELSLDQEISLMRAAPADKRFELMNNIKKRISTMNGAKRAEAISKLTHGPKQGIRLNMNQKRKDIKASIHNAISNAQRIPNKQTGVNTNKHRPKPINKR